MEDSQAEVHAEAVVASEAVADAVAASEAIAVVAEADAGKSVFPSILMDLHKRN